MTAKTMTRARAETHTMNRLTTLLDAARTLHARAISLQMRATARALRKIIETLDGARFCLMEDGADYLDAAQAFARAGADALILHAATINRASH